MSESIGDVITFEADNDKCRTCPGAALIVNSLIRGRENAATDAARTRFAASLTDAQRAVDWCQTPNGPDCALGAMLQPTPAEQPVPVS